ncbi:MAG: 50S ribosomal protein L31e [Candidatus Helarchaeota archaeon]
MANENEENNEISNEDVEEQMESDEDIIDDKIKGEISTELQEEISDEVEKKLIELEEEKEYKPRIIKDEFEEEYVLERTYIVPLSKSFKGSRLRRANHAVRFLRKFVWRHMKPIDVIIHPDVNEKIWERGIEKPPRKIRIRASKDKEGLVYVYLA